MIPQPIDQVPLFLKLTEDERELISSHLRHLEFNTNDVIFAANKPAEMLGIVAQGWVKLESETQQGHVALANLGAGSVIGEVDLLLNRPYSTTVRAVSATSILALSRQDLQEIIIERPAIGLKFSASLGTRVAYLDEYLVTQRLGALSLFSSLSEDAMYAMATQLQFRSYPRGEVLFEAGTSGDNIFLIEEGTARLITTSREGESFDEYKEGDLIGHAALITGKPQASTARAVTELSTWVLTREDYQKLIRQHPAIKIAFSGALAESLGHADQVKAVEQLRALPLFADVDEDALAELASHLVLRHFPAGELIYNECTPGDAMYFIESGQVSLISDASTKSESLNRKSARDSFGEMALLTGRTRAESAAAITDTTLWVLYKSDYDVLMVQYPSLSLALSRALSERLTSTESDLVEQQLTQLKLFKGLCQNELKEIGQIVKPLRFHSGETICFAGQPAQYVYLIGSGEVREIAGGANGQAVVLDLLGAEQSFGERAIVQNSTYPTTMQAVGEVSCWTIAKADFDEVMSRYPAFALNAARQIAEDAERVTKRQPRTAMPPRSSGTPRSSTAPRPRATPMARPSATPPRPQPGLQSVAATPTLATVGVRTLPGKPWERTSNSILRPMPAANARPIVTTSGASASMTSRADTPIISTITSANNNLVARLAALSTGGKVKLAVLGSTVFFLMIVVPLLIIVAVLTQTQSFKGFSATNSSIKELPANIDSDSVRPAAMLPNTGKIAVFERTATPTTLPPTVAPTRKPTVKPTRKPVVLALQATPTQIAVAPTAASVAVAAAVRPPLPPRQWDKRLGAGGLSLLTGVGVTEAAATSGQTFWRLTKMVFQDAGAESGNDHTIYISLVDENGQRVEDQTVVVSWDESGAPQVQRLGLADQKPRVDYCHCNYNWPMYGAGYHVKVDGSLPSDEAYGMIMPMHRHVNYLLTFQRVVMP